MSVLGPSVRTSSTLVSALERLQTAIENPILGKDLRTRMRGLRSVLIQTLYLVAMLVFMGVAAWQYRDSLRARVDARLYGPDLSRDLYRFLLLTQAVVLSLVTPAFTAGSITIEREQQTLDMLLVTRLTPAKLVWGRLLAAGGFAALLLVTSAPLLGICFLLGGVSPEEVAYSYLTLMLTAILFSGFGVCASAYVRYTVAATIIAFLIVAAYITITFAGFVTAEFAQSGAPGASVGPSGLVGLNPFLAVFYDAEASSFFGLKVAAGIPALILLAIGVFVMPTLAIERLAEHYDPRSRPWSRLVATALIVLVPFVLYSWVSNATSGAVGVYFIAVLLLVVLVLPIYASSDGVLPHLKGLAASLNPARWFGPGQPYGLILGLLWCGVPVLVAPFTDTLSAAATGRAPLFPGVLLAMVAVLVGFTLAYGLLAMALSSLTRRKCAALALTYVLLLVTLLVPFIAMVMHSARSGNDGLATPIASVGIYLNPFVALGALGFGKADADLGDMAAFQGIPFHAVHMLLLALLLVGSCVLLAVGLSRERAFTRRPSHLLPPRSGGDSALGPRCRRTARITASVDSEPEGRRTEG